MKICASPQRYLGCMGLTLGRERQTLQPHLLNALSDNAVIMGDFNGTSSPFDTVGAAMGGICGRGSHIKRTICR